jgi:hypothetical protein
VIHYVFTGPRSMTVEQRALALAVLSELPLGYTYITGAQVGLDLLALEVGLATAPSSCHDVWRPAKRHGDPLPLIERHADAVARAGGRIRVHHCLRGTDYPYRNLCMLQHAAALRERYLIMNAQVQVVALPAKPEREVPRSGTWLCVRQAKAAGLPVQLHPLY